MLILASGLTTAIALIITAWTHLWASHVVYETVLCVAEGQSQSMCTNKGRKLFHQFTRWGRLQQLHVQVGSRVWKGSIKWRWFKDFQFRIVRTVSEGDLLAVTRRAL